MPESPHLEPKDPNDKKPYGIDWSNVLGTDTISSSAWTVPTGLTEVSDANTTTTTSVVVSGGTAETTYELVNQVTTAAGYTLERSIFIPVQER